MKRSVLVTVGVLVTACGGGDGPSGPAEPLNIGGVYSFSETATDQEHDVSCNNSGTIVINQTGSTFTGTFEQVGVCTGPGGSVDNSGSGPITGGRINGNQVSFDLPFCRYAGSVSGNPVNRASGTSDCTLQFKGETFNFRGTWQASR